MCLPLAYAGMPCQMVDAMPAMQWQATGKAVACFLCGAVQCFGGSRSRTKAGRSINFVLGFSRGHPGHKIAIRKFLFNYIPAHPRKKKLDTAPGPVKKSKK